MMKTWAITDVGLVRKENQDSYGICPLTKSGHTICVVCDGMGGAAGGQVASQIAVKVFADETEKALEKHMTAEQLKEISEASVSKANQAIREAAEENEDYHNMGTTLVSAVSYDEGMVISNVGDSRAYYINKNGITRVTKDHSLVERMVDRGDITEQEARHHPNRNLITRALGPDSNVQCDVYVCPMHAGDYILLCTDGLVGTVTDQEMLFEVIHSSNSGRSLDRMMKIAKKNGAPDNVTAVLIKKQ